ncbi:MAG: PEP-CTERM sorting domain-containing protein [Limisphaerales bacterium]
MKHIIIILVIGLLSQVSALSQGLVNFDINFGANPPPHTPGDPISGATLTNDFFYAALYLDTTAPISGSIEELDGGVFTTVFQFTNLVYASYPGGGPALDYEGSWQLTDTQIQNLLAGQWYANITYSDASYTGQITPVPEPSSITLLLAGLILVCLYRRIVPPNTALEPTPTAP